MKIVVAGTGYVGLSLGVLLGTRHRVTALDIDEGRVARIREGSSPIDDALVEEYLNSPNIDITATLDKSEAYVGAKVLFVCTPTNYDPETGRFDTTSVESVIHDAFNLNKDIKVVIKSTIPVGFTSEFIARTGYSNIMFSPEFLREGQAVYDNLHPSRIIVGGGSDEGSQMVVDLLRSVARKQEIPVIRTDPTTAEAIKLFSNEFLAMRVAFFNELDNYGLVNGLNVRDLISGVSLDTRVGNYYNNPSFGYGGYCLPKDTKQLLANFEGVPQALISATIESNDKRKHFIASRIIEKKIQPVGVFKLAMKSGSDNYRESAMLGIISLLKKHRVKVIVFEPSLTRDTWEDCPVYKDLMAFKRDSGLIIANRFSEDLEDVAPKVFTRDIFGGDL